MNDGERLRFMGRRLSSDFAMRQVLIGPGSEYAYESRNGMTPSSSSSAARSSSNAGTEPGSASLEETCCF